MIQDVKNESTLIDDQEEQNATQILFQFGKQSEQRQNSFVQMNMNSPGDDEFEEHNMSDDLFEGKQNMNSNDNNTRKRKVSNIKSLNIYDITSNEGSPIQKEGQDAKLQSIHDELTLHKDAYEKVYKYYPPNPILPKNFMNQEGSPRSGGEYAFLKLTKFRGKDFGKSKFEVDLNVNQIQFPDNTTLKSIFLPNSETDDKLTYFGELVFMRSVLDFTNKINQPGTKKDEVLEENLMDVRRILKNSTHNKNSDSLQVKEASGTNTRKTGLIQLHGVEQFYKKKDQFDRTLIFESRFESGNLASALKVNDNDYHLLLQNDVNTSGHTQWFFFRVSNTKQYHEARFNMLNLAKPDSLFNEGMKVLIFSEKLSEEKDIGWHRGGTKISYYQNGIKKESQKRSKSNYTLTFTYEFQYDSDIVYFAYCYPYTYTDLQDDLNRISADPIKSQFCTRKTLCQSIAENKLEMLTITSRQNLDNISKRKGVFLTARVHPGESVGSWMMKGAIDFLTDETSEEAEILRQNFVFKIIPMLNPDGVINGNYRCSVAGCDLNRRWKAPSKVLHPCIYYTKQLMQNFAKERELTVFCDFHGHSRRKNIFMYGCHVPSSPEETRLFPFLLSKLCPFFVFGLSRFGNQKSKEATARIAMFNDLKIPSIYTMESSFCGNDQGPFANYHFSTGNLMQTGRDFCRTLIIHNNISVPSTLANNMLTEILQLHSHYKEQNDIKDNFSKDQEVEIMRLFVEKIQQQKEKSSEIQIKHIKKALTHVLRQTQDLIQEGETTSSAGSDQAPSEDNMEPEEIQNLVPVIDDEQLKKNSRRQRKDTFQQEMGTSISPMRRKNTMDSGSTALGNNLNNKKPLIPSKNKRLSFLKIQDQKLNNNSGSKIQLSNSRRGTIDVNRIEEEEPSIDKIKSVKEIPEQVDDSVSHKKKRKRNVDSRDVWTQTERSDYMLIKYRQKQKQAVQTGKSQKFTKEEQFFYEQALAQHYQQNQIMNKTQEITSSTTSSVNMALSKMIKPGQPGYHLVSQNTQNKMQSSIQQKGNKNQQEQIQNLQPQKKTSSNYTISNSYLRRKSDHIQSSGDGSNKNGNFSRNVQSQQSNPVNKQQKPANNALINNAQEQFKIKDNQQLQVKTQKSEKMRQSLEQAQYNNFQITQYPYQALSSTQEVKNIDRIEYQSNKLSTINTQNTIGNYNNRNPQLLQTMLPQIQTPNKVINKQNFNNTGIIPGFIKNSMKKSLDNNSPFTYYNRNQCVRGQDNNSDLSSNHSTQRIANNISFNMKAGDLALHSSFIDNPMVNNNLIVKQNLPKSLPPKPQTTNLKASQNNSEIMNPDSNQELKQEQKQITNIRVLENTYIQQKLLQQHQEQMNSKQIINDNELRAIADYETIRLDQQQQNNPQQQPKHILKGNFFQNPNILEPQNHTIQHNLKNKNKAKSDLYGASLMQNAGLMQGQSIKKMIENSWKADQQQQLSQSFYQGIMPQAQQQQYFGATTGSFIGVGHSPMKQSGVIGGRQKKHNSNATSQAQPQRQQQVNQFINVQGIIPPTLNNGQNSNNAKVKISIVNVHNEFIINPQNNQFTNVHNNYIITNQTQVAKNTGKPNGQQKQNNQKKR